MVRRYTYRVGVSYDKRTAKSRAKEFRSVFKKCKFKLKKLNSGRYGVYSNCRNLR